MRNVRRLPARTRIKTQQHLQLISQLTRLEHEQKRLTSELKIWQEKQQAAAEQLTLVNQQIENLQDELQSSLKKPELINNPPKQIAFKY